MLPTQQYRPGVYPPPGPHWPKFGDGGLGRVVSSVTHTAHKALVEKGEDMRKIKAERITNFGFSAPAPVPTPVQNFNIASEPPSEAPSPREYQSADEDEMEPSRVAKIAQGATAFGKNYAWPFTRDILAPALGDVAAMTVTNGVPALGDVAKITVMHGVPVVASALGGVASTVAGFMSGNNESTEPEAKPATEPAATTSRIGVKRSIAKPVPVKRTYKKAAETTQPEDMDVTQAMDAEEVRSQPQKRPMDALEPKLDKKKVKTTGGVKRQVKVESNRTTAPAAPMPTGVNPVPLPKDDEVEISGVQINRSTDMSFWEEQSAREIRTQLHLRYPDRVQDWAFKTRLQLLNIVRDHIIKGTW